MKLEGAKTLEIKNYYSTEEWNKFMEFSEGKETPFLMINLDIIKNNYIELQKVLPFAKIFYAVKANPASEIISMLSELGASFDIASIYELRKILALGVDPSKISYGNTIKKSQHIKEAYEAGIKMFASDSEIDLRNIAQAAPGSKVFIRILAEGVLTADWPLSRKFGCQPDMAFDLLVLARKLGLQPYGLSFHVGSQQRDITAWDAAIAKVKYLFDCLEEEGIKLEMINMGGGFPAKYVDKTNDLETYAQEISRYLEEDFGDDLPEIIIEPGRSMVAESGVLASEVVLISRKDRTALERWVYLDVGKFNGLIETLDESIKYPIYTTKNGLTEETILAGPTCDSVDTLYENNKYELPLNLAVGDRLFWLTTGAYTGSYSSVEFNGFPPLKTYII